jgi:hypothetical protein
VSKRNRELSDDDVRFLEVARLIRDGCAYVRRIRINDGRTFEPNHPRGRPWDWPDTVAEFDVVMEDGGAVRVENPTRMLFKYARLVLFHAGKIPANGVTDEEVAENMMLWFAERAK